MPRYHDDPWLQHQLCHGRKDPGNLFCKSDVVSWGLFLYCCSNCLSCLHHLNTIGWATCASWTTVKKYTLSYKIFMRILDFSCTNLQRKYSIPHHLDQGQTLGLMQQLQSLTSMGCEQVEVLIMLQMMGAKTAFVYRTLSQGSPHKNNWLNQLDSNCIWKLTHIWAVYRLCDSVSAFLLRSHQQMFATK